MNQPAHIIDKVVVDIDAKNANTAYFIKDHISRFLLDELLPQIELIFDKHNPGETVVRFNELEVDLTVNNWKNPENLKIEISNRLEEKLKTKIPYAQRQNGHELGENVVRKISIQKNRENVFLFFLEKGYLPWFGKKEHIREITKKQKWIKALQNEHFTNRALELIGKNENAFDRLILQFPPEILISLLFVIHKNITKEEEQKVSDILHRLTNSGRYIFLKLVGNSILKEGNEALKLNRKLLEKLISTESKLSYESNEKIWEELQLVIQKFHPELIGDSNLNEWIQSDAFEKQDQKSETDRIKESEPGYFEKNTNEIAVENAGLILLHPFFKSYFTAIKITDKEGYLINQKKEIAVQALHYLATGNEDFFEGSLMLEKFFSNLALNWPVQRKTLLNKTIKIEADILLKHAIKHWPALKNTSPEGLRQLFLQRNGKLIQGENKFKLIMERKAQDVLLDKLDWNISVIKLPWIEKLLYVEW